MFNNIFLLLLMIFKKIALQNLTDVVKVPIGNFKQAVSVTLAIVTHRLVSYLLVFKCPVFIEKLLHFLIMLLTIIFNKGVVVGQPEVRHKK